MARKSVAIPDTTGPQRTALDDIPSDVKKFVEDVYAKQAKTPGRERVEYDNATELATDFKLMADYCAQRPQAVLKIRKSPTRDLPDNVMDIRIVRDAEANGQRNATKPQGQVAR